MGVFTEEVTTTFEGHQIACSAVPDMEKAGLMILKLHIDGQLVDSASGVSLYNRKALLRGALKTSEANRVVEIFSSGFFNKRLNIHVDGRHIARSQG
jgi:hypothetical protein